MIRLIVFILDANEDFIFTKGISKDDEAMYKTVKIEHLNAKSSVIFI